MKDKKLYIGLLAKNGQTIHYYVEGFDTEIERMERMEVLRELAEKNSEQFVADTQNACTCQRNTLEIFLALLPRHATVMCYKPKSKSWISQSNKITTAKTA